MIRGALHARHALAALALLAALCSPVRSGRAEANPSQHRQLVVLSTTDVKGKTGPCGCHIPKGGLARMGSFADSTRAAYERVLLVTTGGFFPEEDDHQGAVGFLLDAFKVLGTDALGVSEKELLYGRSFLLAQYKRSQAPLVCANLFERDTRRTLVAPYVIRNVEGVTVGIFGLTSEKVDLGVSRDSLTVENPEAAARRTIDELHKKGATVIVLLSSLGKVESEDLVTAVDGVDVVIIGRNVPLLEQGRTIQSTVACYGGEQGQYMGRTIVNLDAANRMTQGENETFILSSVVGTNENMVNMVKSFDEAFNDQLRRKENEKAAGSEPGRPAGNPATQQGTDRSH